MRGELLGAVAALMITGAAQAAPMPEFAEVDEASFTEPSGDRVLVLSTVIDAPVQDAWRIFSTEAGWKRLGVKMARVDFRQGGVIETSYDAAAEPGQAGNIRNLILAAVPERLLVIRNVQAPPGFAHAEEFGRTATAFEFRPEGAGRTRITIRNAGYKPGPAFKALFDTFRMGDGWTLAQLRKQVAGQTAGVNAPPAAAAAMAAYPDVSDASRTLEDGTRMVQQSVVVHAPVSALWNGFTDARSYEAWGGAPEAQIDLKIGGHIEVAFARGGIGRPGNLRHEILAYVPERLLVARNLSAPPGLPGGRVFGETRIILQFEDIGGGDTRVTLSQTGYGQGADFDALWAFFHPHNAEMLQSLKTHFESRAAAQETANG